MSAPVLLNLLNNLRKRDKMQGLSLTFYLFSSTCLINSIIQEQELDYIYHMTIKVL